LYISQPSLSQYIKKIEKEIGIELFDHKLHPIKLTDAGEIYLQTEEKIAALKENRIQLLDDIDIMRRGRITIGSTYFRSTFMLALVLPKFKKKYPGIYIKLEEGTTEELEEKTFNGVVNFSILLLPFMHSNLEYEGLFEERIVLALSPRHPLAKSYQRTSSGDYPTISFYSLRNESFIVMKSGQHIRSSFFTLCEQMNIMPNIILETSNMPTAQVLASIGFGVTIITDSLAKLNHISPQPLYFYIEECKEKRRVVAAYSKKQQLSKATRAFIDTLHENSGSFSGNKI
jgi:DNA-binding transcriptional LysR family regulator